MDEWPVGEERPGRGGDWGGRVSGEAPSTVVFVVAAAFMGWTKQDALSGIYSERLSLGFSRALIFSSVMLIPKHRCKRKR